MILFDFRDVVLLVVVVIWLGSAGTALFAVQARADGRVWHVSPAALPDVNQREQFRSIGEALATVRPGDTVLIHTGTYRERIVMDTSGTAERPIRIMAAPAATVIVTGADLITDWTKESQADNIFSTHWPHVFVNWSAQNTHPDDHYHKLIGRAEQVAVDGYLLRQVLDRNQMARGTFFVDLPNQRLYAWADNDADLTKSRVEASTRNVIWQAKGDHVHLRGIRFRFAANRAQEGAVTFTGSHNVVEDCIFEYTNAAGAAFDGPDLIVRRCIFQDNGQLGFRASGAHRLLFTESLVRNNNTRNYSRGWEAGANKLAYSRGVIIEKSTFIDNRGIGIWFDIANDACVIRHCLIANNENAGIFYEISWGLHAHDNVIIGNGLDAGPGSWGAAAGISISSSYNCIIERNLIIGNKEGFNFREQPRAVGTIEAPEESAAIWNHTVVVRNNIFAYNRDAQTWGWFDINDERHWPAAMQENRPEAGRAAADIAAEYVAKDDRGQPVGLSLETLNLTFENNLYALAGGQELFNWGVTWKRHKRYGDLDEVRRELNLERGSRTADFEFADWHTRDFRIPPDSPALEMNAYPRGEVPGVRLGVMDP